MEQSNLDILSIILTSGPVVKAVLLILLAASIVSWAIIINKKKLFNKVEKNNEEFLDIFESGLSLNEIKQKSEDIEISTFNLIFTNGHDELLKINDLLENNDLGSNEVQKYYKNFGIQALNRSLEGGINKSNTILETKLQTLASIGSVSPFIGLFGTVWGIINSFKGLASGNATLDAVAPGIAEALVATAIGLAAAIPALWFYNSLISRQGQIHSEMENFSKRFLNTVERTLISNK